MAEHEERKHCVAVSSGTAALHAALKALGIGAGDEVIVPDFTFIATANAVIHAGATPIFVDVNEKTFNIDSKRVEEAITNKTKAVIPVSLYGQAYDVTAIKRVCKANALRVVSDDCQAIGAEFDGSRNFGDDFSTLSFYPTKNATTAEGGALLTDDDSLAEQARLWSNIGQAARYDYRLNGFNYRMSSVHAAIGIAQMRKLDSFTEARRSNASLLNDLLEGVVETPFVDPRCEHVYHQYTIQIDNRDSVKESLSKKGVGSGVYYPQPLHSLPLFKANADCPITEKLCSRVLSLPVHPALSEEDLRAVAAAVKSSVCATTPPLPCSSQPRRPSAKRTPVFPRNPFLRQRGAGRSKG